MQNATCSWGTKRLQTLQTPVGLLLLFVNRYASITPDIFLGNQIFVPRQCLTSEKSKNSLIAFGRNASGKTRPSFLTCVLV
jgi:hypothetical protein